MADACVPLNPPKLREQVSKSGLSPFPFFMWLVIHRAQFGVLDQLVTLSDQETYEKFLTTFDLVWEVMFNLHQTEEDNYFFPWVRKNCGEKAAEVIDKLTKDHHTFSEKEAVIYEQVKNLKDGKKDVPITQSLKEFRDLYFQHALSEENEIVPLISSAPAEEQTSMAQEMKARGQAHPRGKFAFALFRDAAVSNPEDKAIWEETTPWFVRNVVLPGISALNGEYAQYLKLIE